MNRDQHMPSSTDVGRPMSDESRILFTSFNRSSSVSSNENSRTKSVTPSQRRPEKKKTGNPESSEAARSSRRRNRTRKRIRKYSNQRKFSRSCDSHSSQNNDTKAAFPRSDNVKADGQPSKVNVATVGKRVLYSQNMSSQRIDSSCSDEDQDENHDSSSEDSEEDKKKEETASIAEPSDFQEKDQINIVFLWNLGGCPVPSDFSIQQFISKLLEIGQRQSCLQPIITCLVDESNSPLLQDAEQLGDVQIIPCERESVCSLAKLMIDQLADETCQYKVYLIGVNLEFDKENVKLELVEVKNGNDDSQHMTNANECITLQELIDDGQKSQKIEYSYVEVDKVPIHSNKRKLRLDAYHMLKCKWCKIFEGKLLLRFHNLSLAEKACTDGVIQFLFGKETGVKILTQEESTKFLEKLKENRDKAKEKQTQIKQPTLTFRLTGELLEAELKAKLSQSLKNACITVQKDDGQHSSKDSIYNVSIILDGKSKMERITKAFQELASKCNIKTVEACAEGGENKPSPLLLIDLDNIKDDLLQRGKKAEENHLKKLERNDIEIKQAMAETVKEDREGVMKTLYDKKEELYNQLQEFQRFSDSFFENFGRLNDENFSSSRLKDCQVEFGCEIKRLEEALPIYAYKSKITNAVINNQVTILLAETGSGKSTQLVQYLLYTDLAKNGVIVCTQPRRIAASSLATHVAHQTAGNVGHVVGYQAGLTIRRNNSTKIMYMTDHNLLSEILEDPDLTKYSCIVIDEAHERSIYTDLLIAMVKRCLQRRSDLRVVITSATIDPKVFVKYFGGCPILKVPGRTFPVKVIWKKTSNINKDNDYIREAVDTVLQIHTKDAYQQRGDVLVFLTGVPEIERALQLMNSQQKEIKDTVTVLPLHGKLQPDQQNQVFREAPRGKRKIIFATNVAETSVTIPGIKFVVDCGFIKSTQFDPKRNIETLDLRVISQSSAEQRKGRAGRMETGVCYRMYSEADYKSFAGIQLPELLRVNLGQAVLKLLELGITNLREFDFVESPEPEALESAISSLEDLEAIVDGRITELGLKMAKLSVIPHLAKLILHGIEKKIGFEAFIIAACSTVNSVFFRSGTDEEKAKADTEKTVFCLPEGDFLTALSVYKEWLEVDEKQKTSWCLEKSINGKALKIARETIKEFNTILKRELGQSVELKFSTSENASTLIRRLVFDSYFKGHLCLSYGPSKAGYLHLATQQRVYIHPSSSLKYLGHITPKFVIYDKLLKTSRPFINGITPVEEEWVKEMVDEKKLQLDLENIPNIIAQPKVFHPIGPMIMTKTLIGSRHIKRIELEKKLFETLGEEVFAEVSVAQGKFTVYATFHHHENIETIINEILKEQKDCLSEAIEERYQANSNLRVLMGRGGLVQHLLYPEDYCEVTVDLNSDVIADEALEVLCEHGKILSQQRKRKKLLVKFRDPQHAKQAVELTEEFEVKPAHKVQTKSNPANHFFRIKVLCARRLNKGFGFIRLKDSSNLWDAIEILQNGSDTPLTYQGYGIPSGFRVTLDKKVPNRLYVRNLQPDLTNEMFRSRINELLRPKGMDFEDAFVILNDALLNTTNEIMESELKNMLQQYCDLNQLHINLLPAKPKSAVWIAFVSFEDPEIGRRVIDNIHLKERIFDKRLFVQPDLKSTVLCRRDIFEAIHEDLTEIRRKFVTTARERYKELTISFEDAEQNQKAIKIVSDSVADAYDVSFEISKLLSGQRMDCSDPSHIKILRAPNGKQFLQDVMTKTSTLILADTYRTKRITLYGKPESITQAKERIKNYFGKIQEGLEEKIISLLGEDKPKGLIKGLLLRYGSTLEGLQQQTEVESLHLDVSKHRLTVFGSSESIEKVNTELEAFVSNMESMPQGLTTPVVTAPEAIVEDCPVCFTPVDITSSDTHFRLQLCGHSYCLECIEGLIASRTFPLKCIFENCDELFCIKDIQILTNQFEKLMEYLDSTAVDDLVNKNTDKFGYCVTPNCKGIYRCSETKVQCIDCNTRICTRCKVRDHVGFSCEEFESRGLKDLGEDYSLKVWMQNTGKGRFCPSCKLPIEKDEGCDHMTCKRCNAHFCWRCNGKFKETVIYQHLAFCHGNGQNHFLPNIPPRPFPVRQHVRYNIQIPPEINNEVIFDNLLEQAIEQEERLATQRAAEIRAERRAEERRAAERRRAEEIRAAERRRAEEIRAAEWRRAEEIRAEFEARYYIPQGRAETNHDFTRRPTPQPQRNRETKKEKCIIL